MHKDKDGKYVETEADKKFFARLACNLPKAFGGGHRRGKRINREDAVKRFLASADTHLMFFECPRCGATWSRKAKA